MKITTSLFALCVAAASCSGQAVLIHEAPVGEGIGPCEPSIAINPANPDQMVVGSVLNNVYWSTDGGSTWDIAKMKSSLGVWGDPVVVADSSGRFYYFHLSDPDGTNWKSDNILDRIVCQWSDDGGKTWSDGSFMGLNPPRQQDKEWAAVDLRSNHIYVTWTQFDEYGSADTAMKSNILFSRSVDAGGSWSNAIRINQVSGDCRDKSTTTEGAVPAVGVNGEIFVAWSLNDSLYFDRSLDGGETWLKKDLVVACQPGGWSTKVEGLSRSNGMPVTAVDLSNSTYRGRVYVCWADIRNGKNNKDIFIAGSDDLGETWTKPVLINQDTGKTMQFFPWIAVDQSSGILYAVYYSRHLHGDTKTDVFLATSKDGGESWTKKKINKESFTPDPEVFFGDYNHIAVLNGTVRPVWTEIRDGKLQIWTALIAE